MTSASSKIQSPSLLSAWSICVFATWILTSFLCHYFAKSFLGSVGERPLTAHALQSFSSKDLWTGAGHATLLTAVQMGMCYLLVNTENFGTGWAQEVARFCHVIATWFTNLSMACMFASSTFAIKLMEPITSAVVQYLVLATPLSPVAILSLPVIVGGAIMFSGNPLTQSNLPFGIAAAFMSNIILAFRNVALKARMTSTERTGITLRSFNSYTIMVLVVVCTCAVTAALTGATNIIPDWAIYPSVVCVLSGFFHVVYSYVSTGIVLLHLSVVSHAVSNILKRILVVLMLYVTGSRSASPTNFLGLGVCTLGLMVYAWTKREKNADSLKPQSESYQPTKMRLELSVRSKYLLLIVCSIFGGMCLSFMRVSVISMHTKAMFSVNSSDRHFGHESKAGLGAATWLGRHLGSSMGPDSDAGSSAGSGGTQYDRTFTHLAHDLPNREDLLPDTDGYLREYKGAIDEFLHDDLISNPNRSSFLSSKLKTRDEIVKEAQRLHFDIMGGVLKKYKYSMLFDIAMFENKGDPCITVGEMYFLSRIKLKMLYYCSTSTCNGDTFKMAAQQARNYSPEELVILVHGGGNIVGYSFSDFHRFAIFKQFQGFQIFVFPQSVYIPNFNSSHFDRCKKEYCCNENVTFVMRDHLSYSYAQKYFNGTSKFILAPDIAFQIGPVPRFLSPVFDIMWIKRGDDETPGYKHIPTAPPGIRVHVSDWWAWATPKAPSGLEKAYYICSNGFFYLQRGRVVVTDRLHGHILATLMNIPHVLIDNKQRKLSSYHLSWTAGLENTVLTDDPSKALDLAMELLRKYNDTLPPIEPYLNLNEKTGKYVPFNDSVRSYT